MSYVNMGRNENGGALMALRWHIGEFSQRTRNAYKTKP